MFQQIIMLILRRYNHATVTVPGDMFPQCVEQGGDTQQETNEGEN